MKGLVLILFVLPFVVVGHICMIWPPQRGGWNAENATPGEDACFQPRAPCGTVPAGVPQATLVGGTTSYIVFQQNLNHYNPGWPGFLDVGYAVGPNHSSDDEFKVLAQIPDYWAHSQSMQTNFTVPILIPNIDCPACTLRVRYHPNKPTEPIFHNCGDIAIKKSSYQSDKRIYAFLQESKTDFNNSLVEIVLPSGKLEKVGLSVPVMKRNHIYSFQDLFLASGVVASVTKTNSIYFIGDTLESFRQGVASPNSLFKYDFNANALLQLTQFNLSGTQWSALIQSNDPNLLLGVRQIRFGQNWAYQVYSISLTSGYKTTLLATTQVNDTYVNFFWADYSPITNTVYVLAGDENSLYKLDAVLYSFDLTSMTTSVVEVDNSKYTLDNFHVERTTGTMYAVSPGLYGNNTWTIVTINPKTGSVMRHALIEKGNEFTGKGGGAVYSGLFNGQIYHMFQWSNTFAYGLFIVNINTGEITLQTDVIDNNQRLHSVTLL